MRKVVAWMLIGRWDGVVDDKWRIALPQAARSHFSPNVFLRMSDTGCVEIHPGLGEISVEEAPHIYEVRVESFERDARLTVPRHLRDSTSFFFGRHIVLVGRITYIEVWPRK